MSADLEDHFFSHMEIEDSILEGLEHEESTSDEEKLTPASLPDELFFFPVTKRPFFPGMAAPITLEPGAYYKLLKKIAKTNDKYIGLVLTKSDKVNIYKVDFDDLYKVGVLAKILRIIPNEKGGAQVILNMEKRLTITKPLKHQNYLKAKVKYYEDSSKMTDELKAYAISILSTIKELLKLNPLFKEELQVFMGHSDYTEPGKLADFAVTLTTASRDDLQEILETFDITKRIEKALILLKKELDISKLQQKIDDKIESTLSKSQREFFLKEQLQYIRKELGVDKDDRVADREKFEERLKNRTIPKEVQDVIYEEFDKLTTLDVQSSEYAISRSYLDWLTILPWGVLQKENHNLKKAKAILEKDHYGLVDIKQRILEFISVGILSGGVKGSTLCLIGPPGVGKTSVGRSIARALNRKFYRFSVGGMRDEAEIKGHRRTYIGAMPGKVIQALKYTQSMNPVIMLDEVDKMGSSYQGDPASALLEVLDPEQNSEFLDHYLDVRCDLSDVLFIATANVLDTIPEPLKDRMEILRLSGYILDEKIQIAKKYLIPKNRKKMGIKASQVSFTNASLKSIINGYAREAGVRSLENQIKKVLRKVAIQIVNDKQKRGKKNHNHKFSITTNNISKYLGNPFYASERIYEKTPPGVAIGLAWTPLGGAPLYIEAIKIASDKTVMHLTGQAGDVMKESAEIAWSYLNSAIHKYAPGYTFFEKTKVHMHIPEGATPKDGPSAGITMVSALLSLLTETSLPEDLAMTGEITLTGKILPIGGVKEKLVASKRSEFKTIIFPKENKRDVEAIPEYIKEGLKIHFVEHYDEVFNIIFPEMPLQHF